MATLEQLSAALVKADAAGNTADAKALANAIRQMKSAPAAQAVPAEQPSEIPTRKQGEATGSFLPSMQTVGNIAAGTVRGIGSIPSTVYGMFQKEGDQSLGQRMNVGLAKMGAEPESFAYGAGKFGGEVLSTAPVGGVLAIPFKAAAPVVATALQTGGMAGRLSTIPRTAALRLGAGATVGATAAGLIGEDAALGGAIGAAIPVAGKVVGSIGGKALDVINPSRLVSKNLAEALNNDPVLMSQVKTLLEQGKTVEEVAAITGSTGLASFAEKAKGASNATRDLYNAIDQALRQKQTNALAAAQQNVNALTQQNLPIATASPTAPRRAVKQALAGEAATLQGKQAALTSQLTAQQQAQQAALQGRQTAMTGQLTAQQQAQEAALAAQRQGVEGGISNVSQLQTGQALARANQEILENTQKTVINPAYDAAFAAAPDPTINVSGLADVAKGQRQELLTQLKGLAPESAELLQRYGPKEVERLVQGVPFKTTVPAKPITLEDAHAIRQAINIDRAALKGSNESGATIARKRLNELYDSLNQAIKRDVDPAAVKLFNDANALFKERIIGVHRTGQPSKLTRTSTLNEPMLLPGDIVAKTMADEGSTLQFLKIFKQDPVAMATLKTGVEDLYRQQVLAGGKAATPAAHAKFMFDNQKQLGALDSAGLSMTDRLNQIGGKIKGVTAAEEALAAQGKAIPSKVTEAFKSEAETLAAQGKAIPAKVAEVFKAEDEALKLASSTLGFRQTDKLRSAVVKDPEVASQALARMDAPAKSSLARGVMLDAGSTTDPLKHLVDNERGIMQVLRAHNPKTAQSVFNTAKETAELTKIIEQTGNKLSVKAPTNAMATQQNINNLTQGLPGVRAAVEEVQQQLARGETFKELAKQGEANVSKMFSVETKPHMFPLNKVWAIANAILNAVEGRMDKELAVKLAYQLSEPDTAAKLVAKMQAMQLAQRQPSVTGAIAAKTLPVAPDQENRNALAR